MGLDQLFGPSVPLPARFIIVFVIVLALMAIFFWILRRVFGGGLVSGMGRRAEQRIHVSEAVNLDGRRKLLIIRRDSVEHLVMIGGPNDVVIESQFTRSQPLMVPREDQEAAVPRSRAETPRAPEPAPAPPRPLAPAPQPALGPIPAAPPARPQPAPPAPKPPVAGAAEPRAQPIPPVARPAAAPAPAAPSSAEPPARPATPADIEREMANLLGAFQKPPQKP